VHSQLEVQTLKILNFRIIESNEEAKRKIENETLFYMPHCEKYLYNNLLEVNWNAVLSKMVIIGNSFEHCNMMVSANEMNTKYHYISQALKFTEEIAFPVYHSYEVFNDLSIHIFLFDKIQQIILT